MHRIFIIARSFSTGIITIPVNLTLRLLMRFTSGPIAAMAVMFLFVLFSNFALVIPMLFFHKNMKLLTIWGEVTAYLNIITLQFIFIIPAGALLFQIWSWTRHGLHIDSRVLVFILAIHPAGGGAGAALALSIIGGLRYTTMPENNIVIPVLSSMRDIHGAPWFSTGYMKDVMRVIIPFDTPGDWKSGIIMFYIGLCSFWFAFSIWREYYGMNEEEWRISRYTPGMIKFDWKGMSFWRKTGSITLALLLFSASAAILWKAGSSIHKDYLITAYGADTAAFIDKSHTTKPGTGIYEVKYYFYAGDTLHEGIQGVEYPFDYHVKRKLTQLPIRYCRDNPSLSRIRYSAIYNLNPDFDNTNGSSCIAIITGLGFFFLAIRAFPGMSINRRE